METWHQCIRSIDGHLDDADIIYMWCFNNKYEELYNCIHYNVQEVEDLKREIDAEINHQLNSDFVIHIKIISMRLKSLKRLLPIWNLVRKSDGDESMVSDHFIKGTMLYFMYWSHIYLIVCWYIIMVCVRILCRVVLWSQFPRIRGCLWTRPSQLDLCKRQLLTIMEKDAPAVA